MKVFERLLRHPSNEGSPGCLGGSSLGGLRRSFVTVLSVILFTVAFSVLTQAHAKLQKTEPADKAALTVAPTRVQLWFSEKPDATVSKIELKGPSGIVKLGPTHIMGEKALMAAIAGPIGDGSYIVNWQTSGDDGHVQKGEFTFTLKHAK
jgi:methionine-rich copper-binding protein CopC